MLEIHFFCPFFHRHFFNKLIVDLSADHKLHIGGFKDSCTCIAADFHTFERTEIKGMLCRNRTYPFKWNRCYNLYTNAVFVYNSPVVYSDSGKMPPEKSEKKDNKDYCNIKPCSFKPAVKLVDIKGCGINTSDKRKYKEPYIFRRVPENP